MPKQDKRERNTKSTAKRPGAKPSGSTGAIDAAKLYTTNCSGCHKDVPAATAEQAKAIIESGKADMPSFKSRLTADEIAALAAYVGAGGK